MTPRLKNANMSTVRQRTSESQSNSSDRQFAFSGRHLLASYSGCDRSALIDVERATAAFHAAIRASGATLLRSAEHTFPPHGFTAVALLSESHASIHTYPEHDGCFVDLFTCVDALQCRSVRRRTPPPLPPQKSFAANRRAVRYRRGKLRRSGFPASPFKVMFSRDRR